MFGFLAQWFGLSFSRHWLVLWCTTVQQWLRINGEISWTFIYTLLDWKLGYWNTNTHGITWAVYIGVFRWAISTGWQEAPLPAAPMVSTLTSSWTEPAHTPPTHRTHSIQLHLHYPMKNRQLSLHIMLYMSGNTQIFLTLISVLQV